MSLVCRGGDWLECVATEPVSSAGVSRGSCVLPGLTAGRLQPPEVMARRGVEAECEGSVGSEDVVKEEAVTLSSLNEDRGEGRRGEWRREGKGNEGEGRGEEL